MCILEAVNNFKTNSAGQNLHSKLTPERNGDPIMNYNMMHNILTESTKKHFLIKKQNSTSKKTTKHNREQMALTN